MPDNQSFRDSISTIDETGKRNFIFPKKPSGKFYEYRKIVSYVLLAFLASAPFVKINGNQFLLFNVIGRRFNFFGFPFWPQDFYLVVIGMIIMVVFVALFTVVYGRLFCGWICPQTIFLEMVFRRIEYWIDGDRGAQQRLENQSWNAEKIRKRSFKFALFFLVSFLIANIFLAYLIGSDELIRIVEDGPKSHVGNFITLLLFTIVFYFVYAWFREQVCIIACPYGRLQGVLLDNKSINVVYDFVRGEKSEGRAKFKKNEDRVASGKGDCIDCRLCVNVCPTGIDIRNGTQLECTNCTACIDECDTIMKGVGLPNGLIRYASEDEIEKKEKFRFTLRMKGYTAVLLVLMSVFAILLALRTDVEASILRLPGQLFEHKGEDIRNIYTFRILNKTSAAYENVHIELLSPKGKIETIGNVQSHIEKQKTVQGTIFVEIPAALLSGDKTKVEFGIYSGKKLISTQKATFLGPRTF
ncbi:MAG: cytochrome c oxidase accessory protein CcoG [Flavobacterium sp.]|uniref:cytochrome c oxidase accessory protein CcoG n=1 Tax=Flavobacterium sp. TaxID=239 RepID=UPI001213FDB6|nr:cytochrome c oxidase accessory protein CcoG [Flavobacterium sp.]RZJ68683.1 MAG: cytochrome c oxidase accessory protein CcoG [Flavobacterium sp.]